MADPVCFLKHFGYSASHCLKMHQTAQFPWVSCHLHLDCTHPRWHSCFSGRGAGGQTDSWKSRLDPEPPDCHCSGRTLNRLLRGTRVISPQRGSCLASTGKGSETALAGVQLETTSWWCWPGSNPEKEGSQIHVKTVGHVNSIVRSYSDREERDKRLEYYIASCRGEWGKLCHLLQ